MFQGRFRHRQPWLEQVASTIPLLAWGNFQGIDPHPPPSHTQATWAHPFAHTCLSFLHFNLRKKKEESSRCRPAKQTNWWPQREQTGIWKAAFTAKSPAGLLTVLSPGRRCVAPGRGRLRSGCQAQHLSSQQALRNSFLWASEAQL